MRIGVDAMGGDYAPREIIRGAIEALPSLNGHELVLIGDEPTIRFELERLQSPAANVQIVHASQVIGMNEAPVEAVRTKKDSSICRMVVMAAERSLDAVISAGNTGAFAAASATRAKAADQITRLRITRRSFPSNRPTDRRSADSALRPACLGT